VGVIRARAPAMRPAGLELSFRRPGVEYLAHCDTTASHQLCGAAASMSETTKYRFLG